MKRFGWMVVVLMAIPYVILAASISNTPLISSPLQPGDRVPVGRSGNGTAATVSVEQIAEYTGSTLKTINGASIVGAGEDLTVVGTGGMADPGANGLMKRTAPNVVEIAIPGTDYVTATGPGVSTGQTFGVGSFTASAGTGNTIYSLSSTGIAVQGASPYGTGGLFNSATGTAGYFSTTSGTAIRTDGPVSVNGTLTSTGTVTAPAFAGSGAALTGITKTQVGLANVDNTSDANKPVSTAQQSALDLKAPLANPTFTGTVSGITKTHVGLANADNTSDANKPVSTAQQTALNLKANSANPTFTGTVTMPSTGITMTQGADPQAVELMEGSASGTNKVTLTIPTAIAADHTYVFTETGITLDGGAVIGGSASLAGLTDVSIVTPTTNDFIRYSGTQWVKDSTTYTTIAGHTAALSAANARFDNLSTQMANLKTAMLSAGFPATPVRVTPATANYSSTTNSFLLNYTSPAGTSLAYVYNGGASTPITTGSNSAALTAPAANTAYNYTVTATKTSTGFTATDSGTFTWTPVASAPTSLSSTVTSTSFTPTWTVGTYATTHRSEYGTTTGYGTAGPSTSGTAITGLTASTAYHWRACADNDYGSEACSADQTATTAAAGALLYETFEGSGYAATGWTTTGTVDADYSTTGLSLEGSQALSLSTASTATNTLASSYNEVWFKTMFRTTYGSNGNDVLKFYNSSNVAVGALYLASNTIHIEHGTRDVASSVLAANTTYYVWIHLTQAATTGVLDLYVSTTSTMPGTPTTTIANGTSNSTVNKVILYSGNGGTYFDHVWLNNTNTGFSAW
ncbi:Fibronectin type III [uncultured Caudovirales phage]|uniref:Fibronectin type III n=1 Tax=uncultured Caudovirales phage TaxID=2100421 RepID=A0A6J5SDF1_9CAUD|nr:Fibronectin type III [uncultured Caudovirales phage]